MGLYYYNASKAQAQQIARMTSDDIERRFVEFDKRVGKRLTGDFGYCIDMYTKRCKGERPRVFRAVNWRRNSKYPTHASYEAAVKKAERNRKMGFQAPLLIQEFVKDEVTFPYSAAGLERALRFVASHADEF